LILTGASHTGKTTVARAVLDAVEPPAAFLSVDDVLEHTMARPPRSVWAEIPLAYDLLEAQLATLLERRWFVVLESTFTYVPESGAPEFHADRLRRLIEVADQREARWSLIQLRTVADESAARAGQTERLPHDVITKTADLHESAALPAATVRLDSTSTPPEELALQALAALGGKSGG
jgi:hypothetical protein